jgi:hypothetical protein
LYDRGIYYVKYCQFMKNVYHKNSPTANGDGMATRLTRLLLDVRGGEQPEVTGKRLLEILEDIEENEPADDSVIMHSKIVTDDLNRTLTCRAKIGLASGVEYALCGLKGFTHITEDRSSSFILLRLVTCVPHCVNSDWCVHPLQLVEELERASSELLRLICK